MERTDDTTWPTRDASGAPSTSTVVVDVNDVSQVGEARRAAVMMATKLGFNETRKGALAIVVTELANNLARHAPAGSGQMILRTTAPIGGSGGGTGTTPVEGSGVEVLALDRGDGIANVASALRDGFTTSRTPGTGLGAVQRLSNDFDLISAAGGGTAIVARVAPSEVARREFDVGAVSMPLKGESVCGDAWAVEETPGRLAVLVADGLGHGPLAAEASQLAVSLFRANAARTPQQIVEALHTGLRPTRGAAVAIAVIEPSKGKVTYCGVGNITAAVVAPAGTPRSIISHNGTLGAEARNISQREERWPTGAMLILCSDGITTRWQLSDYPGVLSRDVSIAAGLIYRDHLRGRDDATVLAIRQSRSGGAA